MNKMPYFTMKKTEDAAEIYIFGDIVPYKWLSNDTTSYDLATQIKALAEGTKITVHINSNGGSLKEGLGIYNVLKGRNVTTICEGFAASSASVIFCAGSRRVMNAASLLFIHNASMYASGNANDFEKAADDLRIVTDAAKAAYREAGVNVSDEELNSMMDNETWITPENALSMGFATEIADDEEDGIRNDVMQSLMKLVNCTGATPEDETEDDEDDTPALDEYFKSIKEELKSYIDEKLATNPTPKPAQVENKGFFGFKEAN